MGSCFLLSIIWRISRPRRHGTKPVGVSTEKRKEFPPMPAPRTSAPRVSTGVEGLDDILGGGLEPNRLYLVEGEPGTGKSTLGLQFLLEGVRLGERALYVTLSETTAE